MKTIILVFDAETLHIDSANSFFNVTVDVDTRDLPTILAQIGVSTIVDIMKNEILDGIVKQDCIEYFDINVTNQN